MPKGYASRINMKAQTFADMSQPEFDDLIERYIEREAYGYGEMPADIFFDLLLTRMAEQNDETANFEISIMPEGNQLVITPDRELSDVVVHGNEILVGGHRLVFQLSPAERPTPAERATPLLAELRDTAERMAEAIGR